MVLATQVALVVKNPPANTRDIRDAILSPIIVCWRGERVVGLEVGGQISYLFNSQVFQTNELFSRNHTQRTSSISGPH